jgi:hypothetical protein
MFEMQLLLCCLLALGAPALLVPGKIICHSQVGWTFYFNEHASMAQQLPVI